MDHFSKSFIVYSHRLCEQTTAGQPPSEIHTGWWRPATIANFSLSVAHRPQRTQCIFQMSVNIRKADTLTSVGSIAEPSGRQIL
jgi:hypothetical protein